ncbi:DUF6292 family protein [Amycolatopsis jiangsuensis]|uniref:DUF6292 domain-containing protein n=1 Tax=Amycolatopsis jiangsuensis TaxID=1181879 RepID=A0A840J7V9_9PSEU|nr:DUF6292 family protein [Amycolatopsis jiangsuensis]MBB4689467.1 hypothetical protein [Amycolatopsis jiangsuensis]
MLRSGPDRPMSLPAADDPQALRRVLVAYVREVAAAVGVSPECTSCEVADTVTAYVALNGRSPRFPGRDLMLLWNAGQGWTLSVETVPAEPAVVVARLRGEVTPEPARVRRFVAELLSMPDETGGIPARAVLDHGELRRRLEATATSS